MCEPIAGPIVVVNGSLISPVEIRKNRRFPLCTWRRFYLGDVSKPSRTVMLPNSSYRFANRSRAGTGNTHPTFTQTRHPELLDSARRLNQGVKTLGEFRECDSAVCTVCEGIYLVPYWTSRDISRMSDVCARYERSTHTTMF